VPPRLPDRYRLNIRLGSDGDIEEWFGQDEALDRPVLIRYLAPESTRERHLVFLESVRSAAALNDIHLQKVFAAAETTASAYSVSEWDGGVTIADRLRADEAIPVDEFLPNASGLCLALSRFHGLGGVHGAIDTSSVHFSAAHPVKLGAFGRIQRWPDPEGDTMALAEVLRAAITGTYDTSVYPSDVIDGVDPGVDDALRGGIDGTLDAAALARSLQAAPHATVAEEVPVRPWRTLAVFGAIVLLISLVAAVGLAADFDPSSPVLYPITAKPTTSTTTVPPQVADQAEDVARIQATVTVYDPLGDGTESDDTVPNATDGDRSTAWETEAYSRRLSDVKDGVGLVFDVDGTPETVYIIGSPGTTFTVAWSATLPSGPQEWEHVARGTLLRAESRMQLPVRGGGFWLLWLTDLPERPDGSFQTRITDIRFAPG
jgi:serine/threonine protein kinase